MRPDPSYNLNGQKVWERVRNDVFGPRDMNSVCNLFKNLINPSSHAYAVCPEVQFSSRWRRFPFLTEEREVANVGEDEDAETKKEVMVEVR